MRLTKQTNYAIRILMYCAANDRELSKTADIARAYRLSELFLFKILQPSWIGSDGSGTKRRAPHGPRGRSDNPI